MNAPGTLPLIASLSGGKDSTAMALWLREQGVEFRAVFCDTSWEAPETYEYLDYLAGVLGQKIERIRGPHTFESLALARKAIPMRRARFCTSQLKVVPFLEWCREQYPSTEIINAVGIRADESVARKGLSYIEPMAETLGQIAIWRPLIRWTEQQVFDCHKRHLVVPNPLYLRGATRVGCYPCIFASKADLRVLPEDRIRRIEEMEASVSAVSAVPRKVSMFSLRDRQGVRHPAPVRDVVAWARTAHGGKQLLLDGTEERGCMRWGLCE